MDASQFADFWGLQGYRVIKTESAYWYSPKKFFFMSIPYHRILTLTEKEIKEVMRKSQALAVRFPAPETFTQGIDGGIFICSEKNYDLPSLDKSARNYTRRGLKQVTIREISFGLLREQGYPLILETYARQGRSRGIFSKAQWIRYCDAAHQIPDFETWGSFVNKELAAFVVCALVEKYYSILFQCSLTSLLDRHSNNALIFTLTKTKLSLPEVTCVSYGFKSLESTEGLNNFKLAMGFRLEPFKDCIVFNPLMCLFLTYGGYRIVKWLSGCFPKSDFWRKVASVFNYKKSSL